MILIHPEAATVLGRVLPGAFHAHVRPSPCPACPRLYFRANNNCGDQRSNGADASCSRSCEKWLRAGERAFEGRHGATTGRSAAAEQCGGPEHVSGGHL